MATAQSQKMHTIPEVAAILRVSPKTVYRRIAAGELTTRNVGTKRRPRARVLDSVLAAFQNAR